MEKEWAIVLAGGGAKGAYQLGVWRALEECGYFQKIGAFFGDSIGSINACLMAGTPYEEAKDAWENLDFFTVFQPDIGLIDGKEGIFSREELLKLFDEHFDFQKIASAKVYVNATKMQKNGEKKAVYFRLKGEKPERIKKIILASSALPVMYESVEIDKEEYRDGGLTDNLPVMPAYVVGYRKIIVVLLAKDTVFDPGRYPDCEMLVIRPSRDLGNLLDGTLNFTESKIRFLMEFGYFDAMAMIAEHSRTPKEQGKSSEELLEEELKKMQEQIKGENGSEEEKEVFEEKETKKAELEAGGKEGRVDFKEEESEKVEIKEAEEAEYAEEAEVRGESEEAQILDIQKRLAKIELQIAAEKAEQKMEEMRQRIAAEEAGFYMGGSFSYPEESAAYRMAMYEFRKQSLEKSTQEEFDKIHSYMKRYGIEE